MSVGGKAVLNLKQLSPIIEALRAAAVKNPRIGSVAGINPKSLSKEDIEMLIKEGFPLTPAPPKGAVANFWGHQATV